MAPVGKRDFEHWFKNQLERGLSDTVADARS